MTTKNIKTIRFWNKLLFAYSYFMAFPGILIFGQNISVLIYLSMLLLLLLNTRKKILWPEKFLQWVAIAFGIGAIISVFNIPVHSPTNSFDHSISVLFNYIYWCILILTLISSRHLLDLRIIYKGISWGLLTTVTYYILFNSHLGGLPMFTKMTPNNFSFLLICYSPILLYYILTQKGRLYSIILLIILVLILLQEGRRAGTVLVLLSGFFVLFAVHLNWKNVIFFIFTIFSVSFLLRSTKVKTMILKTSARIYEMIYENQKVISEDRSYLIRVAMIKKGIAIFKKHPFTGIGLNNFTNYSTNFNRNFTGAKFVANKRHIQKTSSHNSYIAILAEGGTLLFIPFLILIGSGIYYGVINYFKLKPEIRPIYIGFTTMAVHLYFITAIVNVYAWFLIGLAASFIYHKN